MGSEEYFVYDKSGRHDNPLEVMKGLPIAKEASDVGYDIVCGAVAKENINTLYTLFLSGIYPAEAHIPNGAKGIILRDEFGFGNHPEQVYAPLLQRHNIKFVPLSQFAGRFSYDSMFEDFPIKWDGIDYKPLGVEFSKSQVDYVASETAKLHCPAENKAGNTVFEILEAKEHIDTDGSILGVALAKSEHQYVTWDYTYFPKSDFFNGFNNGHYYDTDSAAAAIHDFDNRCKARLGRAIGNVDEEAIEQQIDRSKLRKEIFEKLDYAFRQGFISLNYISVYIDFNTGKPYVDEETDAYSEPTNAHSGKDFLIYRSGGHNTSDYDEGFLLSYDRFLDDFERSEYKEWLQSDEFKELEKNDASERECNQAKIEWLKENTSAYEEYCHSEYRQAFCDFLNDKIDEIIEGAIDTWENLQEENSEVEETSEEEFDREKLKEEILEKIEYAFRHGFANPNYFTVYIDFDTGRPYIDEKTDAYSEPADAYFGKDFSIYSCGGNVEPLETADDEFLKNLESWLDDDERAEYEEWLQSDEFKELEKYDTSGHECDQSKIKWLKENTDAYKAYCECECDEAFTEFAAKADEIAEDAIDTWEETVKEENAAETSFDINECDEPDYWEMKQLAEKEALEEVFEDIEPEM